jgi:hypothetical protein
MEEIPGSWRQDHLRVWPVWHLEIFSEASIPRCILRDKQSVNEFANACGAVNVGPGSELVGLLEENGTQRYDVNQQAVIAPAQLIKDTQGDGGRHGTRGKFGHARGVQVRIRE